MHRPCGATSRSGQPCQRACAWGYTRCNFHGATSPGAQAAAERLLMHARLPAIETLHQILADWQGTACETCGRPDQAPDQLNPVIRVCRIILDRTGFRPGVKLTEDTPDRPEPLDLTRLTDDERAHLSALILEIRVLKDRIRARVAALDASDANGVPRDPP